MMMRPFYFTTTAVIVFIVNFLAFPSAHAFFNDDEARAEIKQLSAEFKIYKTLENQNKELQKQKIDSLETAQQTQYFDMNSKIEALVNTQRSLVGGTEVLQKKIDDLQLEISTVKVQMEGLQRVIQEPNQEIEIDGQKIKASNDEIKLYRFAIGQFKASEFALSANALKTFTSLYSESSLLPNAYYWLGNSYYALNDCRNSMRVQAFLYEHFPTADKVPDALLNQATCYQELGDASNAKQVLNLLVAKFPASDAAKTAESRLKNM